MKYGTIPLVRATGGLDDTVVDFDEASGTGNGFKFREYEPRALIEKTAQAIGVYHKPASWARLVKNAMACDFSWHTSAREYEKLYLETMAGKRNNLERV